EKQVDSEQKGACGCCGLKAFADKRGTLAIVYRSADDTGNRDMTLLLSTDHGKSFKSTVLGPWRLTTCPMSTEALGPGPGDALLAMWETKGQIYRNLITPVRLDSLSVPLSASGNATNRKHPTFAFNRDGKRLLLAWVEDTGWN